MRKIKFRAWYKEGNTMHYDCLPLGGWNNWWIAFDNDKKYDGEFEVGKDIEIMQFTGLQDCNGIEIYEGDIIKFNSNIGEVIYECGSFGIGFKECINYETMIKEIYTATGCDNPLSVCYNDNFISIWEIYWNYNEEDNTIYSVEVIGNIHTNADLL